MGNSRLDLDRAALVAVWMHEHACTVGCELASGGHCNADGLTDADHSAAAVLLHRMDRFAEGAEKKLIDGQVAQAKILGWNMNAGVTDLQVSMALETAAALVSAAKTFLTATGAQNYVEQHVHDRETGERYTLTIQRPGAKTPHELRRQAENDAASLREQVSRVITVLNTWQRWREQADDGAPFTELFDRVLAALDQPAEV